MHILDNANPSTDQSEPKPSDNPASSDADSTVYKGTQAIDAGRQVSPGATEDQREITDEPDDVQEQSPAVRSTKPAHGLADNGEGEFILNESGTSISIDADNE